MATQSTTAIARYPGRCAYCPTPFDVGATIRRVPNGSGWMHSVCPRPAPPAGEGVCSVCGAACPGHYICADHRAPVRYDRGHDSVAYADDDESAQR